MLEYIQTKIDPSSEAQNKLIANIAYCQIGLNRLPEVITSRQKMTSVRVILA